MAVSAKRLLSTQDITWFLDLHERGQLDLEPPYQRKSVWSMRDRRFFINTIFNNFPTPPVYLHRTMLDGRSEYHVVDGKQRLETIIDFAHDRFALGDEFQDTRLDKKRFSELEPELKHAFWNYQLVVEQVASADSPFIRETFDRVNRNTKKLTAQEVRHARFEGWFANRVDAELEAESDLWRRFGVVTPARARRMNDAQFIAELFIVTLEKKIIGFDQEIIDRYYAEYDDPDTSDSNFLETEFEHTFTKTRTFLGRVEDNSGAISKFAKTYAHFYSLWAFCVLEKHRLPDPQAFSGIYACFMEEVNKYTPENLSEDRQERHEPSAPPILYYLSAQSATTDAAQRLARHRALRRAFFNDEDK